MTMISASAAASATAPFPLGSNAVPFEAIFAAAGLLLPHLERGDRVDAATLRSAMETAFGASDATVLVVPTDVRDAAAVDRLFEAAVDRFGRVDAA